MEQHANYTFAQRNDVDVEFAFPETAGGTTPGTWTDELCVDGDVSINDTLERITLTVEDWCSRQTPGALTSGTDGARTVTADMTLQIMVGDDDFQALVENYNTPNERAWVRITRRNRETAAQQWQETLSGRITQLNRTDRAEGTSQVSISLEVHQIESDFAAVA